MLHSILLAAHTITINALNFKYDIILYFMSTIQPFIKWKCQLQIRHSTNYIFYVNNNNKTINSFHLLISFHIKYETFIFIIYLIISLNLYYFYVYIEKHSDKIY